MSITKVSGNIFDSDADVLVNPVNTVGVMGKGLALQFKKKYPSMFAEYRQRCKDNKYDVGDIMLHRVPGKWIANFPTKKHWRDKSRVEYIDIGLGVLRDVCESLVIGAKSVAIPRLGSGLGGLDFESDVMPLITKHFEDSDVVALVYC